LAAGPGLAQDKWTLRLRVGTLNVFWVMDIAAPSSTPQRLPTVVDIRPAPQSAPESNGASVSANGEAKPERSLWQRAFGDDGLSFSTVLDIVNPLQHIPIVSTIYQKITGDVASPAANIIGGALFGGPIGLMVAAADSALKGETGKDVGGHVFALFDSDPPTGTAIAAAAPAAKPSPTVDDATASDASADGHVAEASADDAPMPASLSPPPQPNAQPVVAQTDVPIRSAFVQANSARHASGNGIGGSFVPFETRSTIAVPSALAPIALTSSSLGTIAPTESRAAKLTGKNNGPIAPDLKTLAANPDQMKKLRMSGMRPTNEKPAPTIPSAFANAPKLPSGVDTATPRTDMPASDGNSDGFANLMARNLERYMSVKNQRPAPSRINQSF
jgi:hypothetical protein